MVFLIGIPAKIVKGVLGIDQHCHHPVAVVQPAAGYPVTPAGAYYPAPVAPVAYPMTYRDCKREARAERRAYKAARHAARRGYPVVAAAPVAYYPPMQMAQPPVMQAQMPQPQQSGVYRSASEERQQPRRASLDVEEGLPAYPEGDSSRRRSIDVLMDEKRRL